ncbi:MAG: hypothetical protein HY717_08675 [Planctomycetes bacterium]|nr:hypothetical protein [Planctomycetota bacterium]
MNAPPPASTPVEPVSTGGEDLDATATRTLRLDLTAGILGAAVLAVIEMGPGIAKRGFNASNFEIALSTSSQSLGLICCLFTAHWATYHRKVTLVFWPELIGRLSLASMFFLRPGLALGFVLLHAVAQIMQQVIIPPRVTIYRLNYPSNLRGRIVGRNRQIQLIITVMVASAMSLALDWCAGYEKRLRLVDYLGQPPLDPIALINTMIPAIALLGLLGSFFFRQVPVKENLEEFKPGSLWTTLQRFVKIWREDKEFRRYQFFFLIFGFANIMTIPLTQIHAVEVLKADYFDLALINVILVQGLMALTMTSWGKLVDRYPPTVLRGILNLIFAIDLLALAFAPSLGWVFLGRICRGIALGGGTLVWMLGSLYYARSEEEVPVYLGIHTVMTGFRWAIAPFAGVWLMDLCGHNARPVFFICFLVIVGTAIWMILDARKQRLRRPLEGLPPMPAPRTPGA